MPRITGVNALATSFNGLRHLCITIDLNFCSTVFFDPSLMNVACISKIFPLINLNDGCMVKHKKLYPLAYFFSLAPQRFTIFVFTGCSSSLQLLKLPVILFSTYRACFSVLQCTTISSAYL